MNTPLNNKSSDPTDLNGQLEQVGQIIRMLDGEFVGEKRRAGKFEDRQSVETGLLSFVIPAYDEEETLGQLYEGIAANIPGGYQHEVILVDDGSQDETWQVIERLAKQHPLHVRGVRFRHNVGKATALNLGCQLACGEIVFTMDADLQDGPQEIPRFLEKLHEGLDIVSGWKRVRHDPWHKVFPSHVFNVMVSRLGRVKLHDHNCGFKCYRAEVVKSIELHGELHRLIPSLAAMSGFQSTEIEVCHHPRRTGRSKYGIERLFRDFSDMLTIGFLRRIRQRPSHFFNAVAAIYMFISLGLVVTSTFNGADTVRGTLTFLTGFIFGGLSIAVFLVGLVSEMLIRGPLLMDQESPVIEDTGRRFESPPDQPQIGSESLLMDFSDEIELEDKDPLEDFFEYSTSE